MTEPSNPPFIPTPGINDVTAKLIQNFIGSTGPNAVQINGLLKQPQSVNGENGIGAVVGLIKNLKNYLDTGKFGGSVGNTEHNAPENNTANQKENAYKPSELVAAKSAETPKPGKSGASPSP